MQYIDTNNLRLEVEAPTNGLPNIVQNPSGETGTWGWISPVANTLMRGHDNGYLNGPYLYFYTANTQAAHFTTEFLPAIVGKYYSARLDIVKITTAHNIKVRFEWYNASKVLLSSSTQSGALTSDTVYYGSVVAPANTAYVKLRVDFYNGTGNASATASIDFKKVMVTYTDTGTVFTKRTNLVKYPSFEVVDNPFGAKGWMVYHNVTLTSGDGADQLLVTTPVDTGTYSLKVVNQKNTAGNAIDVEYSEASSSIPVTAGKQYRFQIKIHTTWAGIDSARWVIAWTKANGQHISTSYGTVQTVATNAWTTIMSTQTAPTGAVQAYPMIRVLDVPKNGVFHLDSAIVEQSDAYEAYFDGTTADTASVDYAWTGVAHESTSTATTTGNTFEFSEPNDWQDILGPTHEIKISKSALNVGTLSASILDAMLDPAVADTIRPGKKIRVMTTDANGTWENVYVGRLANAYTTYDKQKVINGEVKVRIEINAVDNIATLSNIKEERGVSKISELPVILEGKGVPWNINGSGNQVTTFTQVNKNANTSVLDQVAIARDSALGYAWVDRANVLNAWDSKSMPVHPSPVFNGTFETDVTGWTATNGTIVRDTTVFRTGVASMKVTANAAGNVIVTMPTGTAGFRIGGGQTFHISRGVKHATTSRTVTTRVNFYKVDGTANGAMSADLVSNASWILYNSFNWNAQPDSVYAAIEFVITGAAAGEVFYFDDISLTYDPMVHFSDAAPIGESDLSYSAIDVDFNTEACINDVTVKWMRYNPAKATEAEEVIYNAEKQPTYASSYRDTASINTWGPRSAEFTIGGASESAANIAAYAASILAANANPQVKCNSLTMPVRTDAERKYAALLDLYSAVSVKYADKVDDTLRITSIEHTITTDKWLVTYGFDSVESVASPTWTPSPEYTGNTVAPVTFNEVTVNNQFTASNFIKKGTGSANINAINTMTATNITFATPFDASVPVPTVMVTMNDVTHDTSNMRLSVTNVTRSGFTVQAMRTVGTTNIGFFYVAVAV